MDNISVWVQANPTGFLIIFIGVCLAFIVVFAIFGAKKRKEDKAKEAALLAKIPDAAIVIFEAHILEINGTAPTADMYIKKQYTETYYFAPGTHTVRLEVNKTTYGQRSTYTLTVKPGNLDLTLKANTSYYVDFNQITKSYDVKEKKSKRPKAL